MTSRTSSLFRLIQGPVLMMLLGALFLLNWNSEYAFSRTWPVLLIALGVLKLIERIASRPGQDVPGGNQ